MYNIELPHKWALVEELTARSNHVDVRTKLVSDRGWILEVTNLVNGQTVEFLSWQCDEGVAYVRQCLH